MNLAVKRGNVTAFTLKVDESTVRTWKLMGEKEIRVNYESTTVLDLRIGDYITVAGENYTINTLAGYQKQNNYKHVYNIVFESDLYRLYDKKFKDEGKGNFPYSGTPLDFVRLLVDNINEIDEDWAVGFVDEQETKTLEFENISCREALNKIAEAFAFEWYLTGKTINLVKSAGNLTTHVFEYGAGKGLYSLAYQYQQDKNIVTRAWGYGSTRNLPKGYRNGADRLMFDGFYLENNTDIFKIKEGDFVAEEIYPHYDGVFTAVSVIEEGQKFSLTDVTLDFNLNNYFQSGGEKAKVVFKSGDLQGKEFEIDSYNHATKTIVCVPLVEQSGYTMPNASFSPAIGDKYTIVDIEMPESYVIAAEAELKAKTLAWLMENSVPRALFTLTLSPVYAYEKNIVLKPGDKIRVKATEIGLDEIIRVASVSYPLNFPEGITTKTQISVEVANFVPYSVTERVVAATVDNKKEIKVVNATSIEKARRNAYNMQKLQSLLIDPDGYFDVGNIKPGSIETISMTAGVKSQNFKLNGVKITSNVGGNENAFSISSGKLIHLLISIEGLGFTWDVEGNSWNDLVSTESYYIYARCSKTALTGQWQISDSPVMTEQEVGYYYFNLGVLYEAQDGWRDFDFTNGATNVVGNRLTTGRVQDITKQNFFDLDEGTFNLGNEENGLDWGVSASGKLTLRGALVQSAGGITVPLPLFRGAYESTATYYKGESVSFNGSTWIYVNDVPAKGEVPAAGLFWAVQVQKGADGQNGVNGANGTNGTNGTNGIDGRYTEYRFIKNGSPNVAPAAPEGANPGGWTIAQPALNGAEYLWVSSVVKNGDGSLFNAWSAPVRFTPVDGQNGTNGAPGPYVLGRGAWDEAKEYYGGANRVEVVKYLGTWYVTRSDAGNIAAGTLPTEATKFNQFGGEFESIATQLFFAELAYIENLGVRHLKTNDTGKRIEIDGDSNNLRFFNSGNQEVIRLDDDSSLLNTIYTIDDWNPPIFNGVPYYPPNYIKRIHTSEGIFRAYFYNLGAGISFGTGTNDPNGYTSVGQARVFTTGDFMAANADKTKQSKLSKDGLEITGGKIFTDGRYGSTGEFQTRAKGGDVVQWEDGSTVTLPGDRFVKYRMVNGIICGAFEMY